MTLNWRDLNQQLSKMAEQDIKRLLDAELDGDRRSTVVVRLHQRFTALRATRERAELLAKLNETRPAL